MITIDRNLVSSVTEEARKSPRLRKNYNFHTDYADPVNRMLNAFEPGTYVRPHKHESPDKWEVFIVLTGKAVAIRFDAAGNILDRVILDAAAGTFGVEFATSLIRRETMFKFNQYSGIILPTPKPYM